MMNMTPFFVRLGAPCLFLTATLTISAPLPDGTRLSIEPGMNCGTSSETGSCTGFYAAAGFIVWSNLEPGADGGIILGKNQLSGGQEFAPSTSNTQIGDITAAWNHFGAYGTLATAPLTAGQSDASANFYSDVSCTGINCIGNTEIGTLHYAWNGDSLPLGTVDGNTDPACYNGAYGEELFVRNWQINSDNSYLLDYANCITEGGFTGIPFIFKLRGQIEVIEPPATLTGTWQAILQNSTALYIFGSGFVLGTTIYLDGAYHSIMQRVSDDMLIAIVPGQGLTSSLEVRTPTSSASTTLALPSPDVLDATGLWPAEGGAGDIIFVFGSGFSAQSTIIGVGSDSSFGQVVDDGLALFIVSPQMTSGVVTITTPTDTFASELFFTVN